MKRWVVFSIVLVVVFGAVILSERRKADAPVKPDPLVYFVADTEREMTRLPVAVTRLSDAEEIRIGDELAHMYVGMRPVQGDAERAQERTIEAYVIRVGSRVAAYAHRKLPYKFHYIPDSNFINAFALPGGHVFIGRGLLALMDSEDELASVLGHEIEHIDHYHCAERAQMEARLRKIPLGALVELPVQVFTAGYSKDQELESDREGTKLAVWASYSPLGAIRMFETFDRLYSEHVTHASNPQEELTLVAIQTIQDYFRSHPTAAERVAQIRRMISDEHWETRTQERDLEVGYFFWTERARQACAAGKYQRCAGLATRALAVNPNQPQALEALARAQFMMADFAGAASSYRKYLDDYGFELERMHLYADSLFAQGDLRQAALEFGRWMTSKIDSTALLEARVDLAGLEMVAGKVELARGFANQESLDPLLQARLGWWYYRARKADDAVTLLNRAVQQRPGTKGINSRLGWALIEQRMYELSIHRFDLSEPPAEEVSMGLTVARWDANQKELALDSFVSVTADRPHWLNPRWVEALYSPAVAKSVVEMQSAAQKKRNLPPAVAGRP